MKTLAFLLLVLVVVTVQGGPILDNLPVKRDCMIACFVDPCMFAKCPSNPTATCRSQCCTPRWSDSTGRQVTC